MTWKSPAILLRCKACGKDTQRIYRDGEGFGKCSQCGGELSYRPKSRRIVNNHARKRT